MCRREGMKLYLKGEKCYKPSCPIEKRGTNPPGQHGPNARRKPIGYGEQLREKQRVKRIYNLLETQFRNYFEKAAKRKGVTGEMLLELLERRLDNVIFRLGFAMSRRQARQFVRHGHVQGAFQTSGGRGRPGWLEIVSPEKLVGRVVAMPRREDIDQNINEQLIVELYSK